MKRIKHQLEIRLCSQAGESIGETLVALLVSALALVMLAGAIASGTNVITRSRDTLDSYYNEAEDVIWRTAAAPITGDITITDSTGNIKIIVKDDDTDNTDNTDDADDADDTDDTDDTDNTNDTKNTKDQTYTVACYENSTFPNTPVISYKLN